MDSHKIRGASGGVHRQQLLQNDIETAWPSESSWGQSEISIDPSKDAKLPSIVPVAKHQVQ